jgi:hypothetical protein
MGVIGNEDVSEEFIIFMFSRRKVKIKLSL